MTSSMTSCVNSSCDQNHSHEKKIVQVHGPSGDPLHEEADRLAVEGADNKSDYEDTLYLGARGQEIGFNWVDHDDADESKSHTWCPTVKKRIKAHEEKMSWQTRSQKTHAEEFLGSRMQRVHS